MKKIKLGDKVKDTITGFKGIAIAKTNWLYGCTRYGVQPEGLHEQKPVDAQWFDEPQLTLVEEKGMKQEDSGPYGPRNDPNNKSDPNNKRFVG